MDKEKDSKEIPDVDKNKNASFKEENKNTSIKEDEGLSEYQKKAKAAIRGKIESFFKPLGIEIDFGDADNNVNDNSNDAKSNNVDAKSDECVSNEHNTTNDNSSLLKAADKSAKDKQISSKDKSDYKENTTANDCNLNNDKANTKSNSDKSVNKAQSSINKPKKTSQGKTTKKKTDSEDLHSGHRSRIRKRMLQTSVADWVEHEVMETLLFGCCPRRNTNEIAHRIINYFGSFEQAINADVFELQRVEGVTETMAEYIALFKKFTSYRAYLKSKAVTYFSTFDDVYEYLADMLGDSYTELVCVYFLTCSFQVLGEYRVDGASPTSVQVSFREIAERCLRYKAASVLLIHTHPAGFPEPSLDDDRFTKDLKIFLEAMDVTLFDHLIWSDGRIYSYNIQGRLKDPKDKMWRM